MPATPMTAASDVFDGLVTPPVAAAGGAAAGVTVAAELVQPSGAVAPSGSATPSGSAGGMEAEPDVFDFLQTPAPGSPADEAAPVGRGLESDAGAGASAQHQMAALGGAAVAAPALAAAAVGKRPGFHLDINQLAESSESGKLGLGGGPGCQPGLHTHRPAGQRLA